MRSTVRWGLVAASVMTSWLLAQAAAAQDVRPYFAGRVGWSGLGEMPIHNPVIDQVGLAVAKAGVTFGAEAGLDTGVLRPSLRLDYRRSELARVESNGLLPVPIVPGDAVQGLTLMTDTAIDFGIPFTRDLLEAYVGVGIGAAWLEAASTSSWEFAYSALAGLYVPVIEPIGIELGYRYTGTTSGIVIAPNVGGVVLDWQAQEVTVGLRWVFGARSDSESDEKAASE